MGTNVALAMPEPPDEPEIPKDEINLDVYKPKFELIKKKSDGLTITNDEEEEAALTFIAECKTSFNNMEEERKGKVKDHNDYVGRVNKAYKTYTDFYELCWKAADKLRSAYVTKKQERIAEANRKAIADAEQKRRDEEAKAEAARQEAERLRQEAERIAAEEVEREYQAEMARLAIEQKKKDEVQAIIDAKRAGDEAAALVAQNALNATKAEEEAQAMRDESARLAAIEEKARLEKAAIKQDAKGDMAESKATMVSPMIQGGQSATASRSLENGASVGGRKTKRWVFTNGLPETSTPCRNDPRFKDIGDEFFEFNPTIMNRMVKAGVKPAGVTVIEDILTTVRKAWSTLNPISVNGTGRNALRRTDR